VLLPHFLYLYAALLLAAFALLDCTCSCVMCWTKLLLSTCWDGWMHLSDVLFFIELYLLIPWKYSRNAAEICYWMGCFFAYYGKTVPSVRTGTGTEKNRNQNSRFQPRKITDRSLESGNRISSGTGSVRTERPGWVVIRPKRLKVI
jgi:hypothetical protein